jgi:hypothetical protein
VSEFYELDVEECWKGLKTNLAAAAKEILGIR